MSPKESTAPDDHLRLVQEASYLVLGLSHCLHDGVAAYAKEIGLTVAQAKVLMALRPEGLVSQRELADQLDYDPSNLTGLIDKLEERGAVRRQPDSVDRRVNMIVISDAGRQIRDDFWTRLTTDAGPLAHLTLTQVRRLRDSLRDALNIPPSLETDEDTVDPRSDWSLVENVRTSNRDRW